MSSRKRGCAREGRDDQHPDRHTRRTEPDQPIEGQGSWSCIGILEHFDIVCLRGHECPVLALLLFIKLDVRGHLEAASIAKDQVEVHITGRFP